MAALLTDMFWIYNIIFKNMGMSNTFGQGSMTQSLISDKRKKERERTYQYMHGYKFWNTIIFYLSTELTRNFCVLTMFLHLGIQFFNLAQDIFRICPTLRRQAFDNKDGPNKRNARKKKISGIFQQIEDSHRAHMSRGPLS